MARSAASGHAPKFPQIVGDSVGHGKIRRRSRLTKLTNSSRPYVRRQQQIPLEREKKLVFLKFRFLKIGGFAIFVYHLPELRSVKGWRLGFDTQSMKGSNMNIRQSQMRVIEDLFGMGGGYVLDFTNREFSNFFQDEIGCDIYAPKYAVDGNSKAKRLGYFLRTCSQKLRLKALLALWEYREAERIRSGSDEKIKNAEDQFYKILVALGGKRPPKKQQTVTQASSDIDTVAFERIQSEFNEVIKLEPHPRGLAFERFLKNLFDANGLHGRSSFRITGEQIDGSFELNGEVYLLEAKWTNDRIGSNQLYSFNGKVESKSAWSRGLYISYSGFSEEGITAFGKGKRLVCMDGLDISDMLARKIPFAKIMKRKIRRVAESGEILASVRQLFP